MCSGTWTTYSNRFLLLQEDENVNCNRHGPSVNCYRYKNKRWAAFKYSEAKNIDTSITIKSRCCVSPRVCCALLLSEWFFLSAQVFTTGLIGSLYKSPRSSSAQALTPTPPYEARCAFPNQSRDAQLICPFYDRFNFLAGTTFFVISRQIAYS